MADRINLTIDVPNLGQKRINARNTLPVANLLAIIVDKWNLDGLHELRSGDGRLILPQDKQLNQLEIYGVSEGATLVCRRMRQTTGTQDLIRQGRQMGFSKHYARVFVRDERTLREFPLRWQPAIIGRRNLGNPEENRLLAVDLTEVEDIPSVSRHHACITESKGSFFVEDVHGKNPVYVNEKRLTLGERAPLTAGTVIRVGDMILQFQVVD